MIRKERRNNLVTREERTGKFRTLSTPATAIDASYVRDLELVQNSVLAKNQQIIAVLFLLVSTIGGLGYADRPLLLKSQCALRHPLYTQVVES